MNPGLGDLGLIGLTASSHGDTPCTDNFREGVCFLVVCVLISWDYDDPSDSKLKNFPRYSGY